MQSQSRGVATELVLERYQAPIFILSGAVLALRCIVALFLSWGFLRSLSGLVPPPLVDLLLRHFEIFFVKFPHFLDAFSGPHYVFLEFWSQNFKFSFSFSFPLSQNFILSRFLILWVGNSLYRTRWPPQEVIRWVWFTKRTFNRALLPQADRRAREVFQQELQLRHIQCLTYRRLRLLNAHIDFGRCHWNCRCWNLWFNW